MQGDTSGFHTNFYFHRLESRTLYLNMFFFFGLVDLFKDPMGIKVRSYRGQELSQAFGLNILRGSMNWVRVPAELEMQRSKGRVKDENLLSGRTRTVQDVVLSTPVL